MRSNTPGRSPATWSVELLAADGRRRRAETTAIGIYMGFWFPDVPQWLWVVAAIAAISAFNLLNVKVYGELEFWFAIVKVVTIVLMIAGGALIVFTGIGHGGAVGLSNLWRHGGRFRTACSGRERAADRRVFVRGVEMIGLYRRRGRASRRR